MTKRALNLSIDPAAVDRARRYADRHGTSLSELVNDFFASLPAEAEGEPGPVPTAVRRLLGIGRGEADEEDYRAWLLEKHGP